jgi:hypothetical protein
MRPSSDNDFTSRLAAVLAQLDDGPEEAAAAPFDIAEVEHAYEAAGGDLEAADRRLAALQQRQTEAFAAIVRALALAYRAGPPASLGDDQLTSLALEGQQLVRNWAERDCEPTSESGLHRLLEAHERIAEDLLLAIDEIVWPYVKLKGL